MRADELHEDNDSDTLPRRGGDCPYYRPMSVLDSSQDDRVQTRVGTATRHGQAPHRSRTANTNNPCVLFVINQRNMLVNSSGISGASTQPQSP